MINQRTDIPEEIYHDEVVRFLADRYHAAPRDVLQCFLDQNGHATQAATFPFQLEENEMAILRDMLSTIISNDTQLWTEEAF